MKRSWNYLTNPFIIATSDSYSAMKKIANFTYCALSNVIENAECSEDEKEFFIGLRDELQPSVEDFNAKYGDWQTQIGNANYQASQLANSLAILRGLKIRQWDLAIQGVYDINSPDYSRLLPHRRIPFQSGTQDERLKAVKRLNAKLATDKSIPEALKIDVSEFTFQLESEIKSGSPDSFEIRTITELLEASRFEMCIGLYGVLSQLMYHYRRNPDMVARFFDLQTISNHEQTVFRKKLKAAQIQSVMNHKFATGEKLRLVNTGNTVLRFYLAANENDDPGKQSVIVASHTEQLVLASDLGDIDNRYLKVVNENGSHDGHYMTVLV